MPAKKPAPARKPANIPVPKPAPAPAAKPQTIPGRNGGTLKPVQPGENRNPKGRGKGTLNTKTVLRRWLEAQLQAKNPISEKKEDMSLLDVITLAQIDRAMKGDTRAYTALLDRLDGRPAQQLKLTGGDDGPIKAEFNEDIDYSLLDTATLQAIAGARTKRSNG